MRPRILATAGLAAAVQAAGTAALAGAWPMEPGRTQVIVKYEAARAVRAYDEAGALVPIPERTEAASSVFAEHGLTRRLTVQAKMSHVRGREPFVRYQGRGPAELGLRLALLRTSQTAVSLYAGAVFAGEGRNAGYAAPGVGLGVGKPDYEARLLAGRSGRLLGRPVFAEVQAARLQRRALPDETRLDTTLGIEPARDWLFLVQTYAGRADAQPAPAWLKAELSAVRRLGVWRVQAGWRAAAAGRASPAEQGPVLGFWRRF